VLKNVYSLKNQLLFAALEQIGVGFTHDFHLLTSTEESGPKGPGFGLSTEGVSMVFPLLRQPAGETKNSKSQISNIKQITMTKIQNLFRSFDIGI
jgi:hypothetical protein